MSEGEQTERNQIYALSDIYKLPEFKRMRAEYDQGMFRQEENDLEQYVRENKSSILELKLHLECAFRRQFDAVNVLKMYIAKTKTINPMHELEKEIQEIFRECYFR